MGSAWSKAGGKKNDIKTGFIVSVHQKSRKQNKRPCVIESQSRGFAKTELSRCDSNPD